ncbi:histone-lysine N-methyltransferase SETMAR-like [Oppia nitens]|uniref:histone-lysine N-methyltransferase SETMAR-like n=1 Tax=Oppia nitens TaxID=1686743 RepID=UPI0023DA0046|nr:histone-lysine N-methyltransferase SETMAR-like [Oppia nitens]
MELSEEHKRVIIYYEFLSTQDPNEIHRRMVDRLGNNSPAYSTITKWIRHFKLGVQSLKDGERKGPEVTVSTPENAAAVEKIIRADPWITYRELEEKSGIHRTTLQKICTDLIGVRKRLCRFVPHFLSDEQKQQRVNICRENLKMWKNKGHVLIDKITTGDETYVHYYEPKLSREAKIFVFEDEVPPDIVKRDKTIGKVMYAVFFNTAGLVAAVKLCGQKTATALWYTTQCLPKVIEGSAKKGMLLHHDNSRVHTAKLTQEFLAKNNVKTVPHPPYSPDLAMCDFWLFSGLKHFLRGQAFKTEEELDCAVMEYFHSISEDRYKKAFEMWRSRMELCIELGGDYI